MTAEETSDVTRNPTGTPGIRSCVGHPDGFSEGSRVGLSRGGEHGATDQVSEPGSPTDAPGRGSVPYPRGTGPGQVPLTRDERADRAINRRRHTTPKNLRPLDAEVGERLRALRDQQTVDRVARAMRLRGFPWSPSTVSQVEHGKRSLKLNEAVALATYYRVSIGHLVGAEPETRQVRHAQSA